MNAQSNLFEDLTLPDTPSAISLQVFQDGDLRSDKLAGLTTNQSGREVDGLSAGAFGGGAGETGLSGWSTPRANENDQGPANRLKIQSAGSSPAHIPLLATGVPQRVGKLKGYGNAIVVPLAAEVIKAWIL